MGQKDSIPGKLMEANDHERMDEENDDPVVAEYDVFFHNTLSKSLTLFQYPLRPGWKSYEIRDEDEESMLTFFPACPSYSTSTYRSTQLSFYLLFFHSFHTFLSFIRLPLSLQKRLCSQGETKVKKIGIYFSFPSSARSRSNGFISFYLFLYLFCIDSHMHTLYLLIFTLTNKQLLTTIPFSSQTSKCAPLLIPATHRATGSSEATPCRGRHCR